jgi:hypothetical protein
VDEMAEDSLLVEVKAEAFTAIVPAFHTSPAEESNIILSRFLNGDKQGAFEQALSMFIDSLAPEKVNEFYKLEDRQMVLLVADWLAT